MHNVYVIQSLKNTCSISYFTTICNYYQWFFL